MTRRAQLICQHLENISRKALEEHQAIIRAYVRGRQGVYALYRRGKLYYVGLATNLRNRLSLALFVSGASTPTFKPSDDLGHDAFWRRCSINGQIGNLGQMLPYCIFGRVRFILPLLSCLDASLPKSVCTNLFIECNMNVDELKRRNNSRQLPNCLNVTNAIHNKRRATSPIRGGKNVKTELGPSFGN